MILLDSSVVIDFWKSPREEVASALDQPDVCLCGVTLSELMHGALNREDCARIERDVGRFIRFGVRDEDWAALGRNLFLLRTAGIRVPFQDVLLATVAIIHGMELWTLNGHYSRIQTVLTDLKLFQGPQ